MTSNPFLHLLELLEANVAGVLSEALTAHVEVVLPVRGQEIRYVSIFHNSDD